jgi:hypothetical protein
MDNIWAAGHEQGGINATRVKMAARAGIEPATK